MMTYVSYQKARKCGQRNIKKAGSCRKSQPFLAEQLVLKLISQRKSEASMFY
jgi:ribosomal protein L40E